MSRIFNTFKKASTSAGVAYTKVVGKLDIITADGGQILVDGSQLSGTELGVLDGVTAGTAQKSKALVLNSSGGVSFSSVAPVMTDADNALISFGTWNDEVDVGTHTAHFVPFQVHIHSTSASAFDIAAMRLRVDTDGDNTGAALQVLQIRSSVSNHTNSIGTMGAGLSIDAACNVLTGEVVCGGFSIAGGYKPTISGPNKCTVLQACNWNTYAGTSVDYIIDSYQNGTGNTVTALLRGNVIAGTATNGLQIVNTSGTLTNAINVSGTVTKGLSIEVTTAASGRASYVSGTVAAPVLADGYGYIENMLTVTGTATGPFALASNWVNFNASSSAGANIVYLYDDGFWASATGTPCASATLIAHRIQFNCTNFQPAAAYLFQVNPYNISLTSIFTGNDKADFGWVTAALSSGACHFPLIKIGATTYYVNCYTS